MLVELTDIRDPVFMITLEFRVVISRVRRTFRVPNV